MTGPTKRCLAAFLIVCLLGFQVWLVIANSTSCFKPITKNVPSNNSRQGTYIVGYMGTYIPYIVTKFPAAQVKYPFRRYLVITCSDSTWQATIKNHDRNLGIIMNHNSGS